MSTFEAQKGIILKRLKVGYHKYTHFHFKRNNKLVVSKNKPCSSIVTIFKKLLTFPHFRSILRAKDDMILSWMSYLSNVEVQLHDSNSTNSNPFTSSYTAKLKRKS
jgi:hypothetical protein